MVSSRPALNQADLRHRDEQVEHLGTGEVVGTGGEDLLEADRALTQILFEFRPDPRTRFACLSAIIRRSRKRSRQQTQRSVSPSRALRAALRRRAWFCSRRSSKQPDARWGAPTLPSGVGTGIRLFTDRRAARRPAPERRRMFQVPAAPRGRLRRGRGDLRAVDQAGRGDHRRQQPAVPRPRRCAVRGGGRVAVRRAATGRGGVAQRHLEDAPALSRHEERHRRLATELMPSVRLCGQLPAAVAKGGLARPPFAQLGSPRRPVTRGSTLLLGAVPSAERRALAPLAGNSGHATSFAGCAGEGLDTL
jgi:hypothetical protein